MKKKALSSAMIFIIILGVVSLFSDMTHEGAKSIMGPFLTELGASTAIIGFVTGLGEFLGYALRLVTGRMTDRTKKYWLFTILGYSIDVLVIPLLAFVPNGGWIIACSLLLIGRVGKAIKKPAKNSLVSFASAETGSGKGFALQEFIDQIGAFLGPLLLFVALLVQNDDSGIQKYSICFLILLVPAVIAILLLFYAKKKYPHPEEFEKEKSHHSKFLVRKSYIFYLIAISLFAVGFIDFPLITIHVDSLGLVNKSTLPLLYSGAMLVDAFAALLFGWLYDKIGMKTLMITAGLSSFFAIFVFSMSSMWAIFFGIALWGVGMGAQESILKAAVASITSKENRSKGYAVFETSFGFFWFLGSWLTGYLYEVNMTIMIVVSVVPIFASIIFFYIAGIFKNREKQKDLSLDSKI